MRCIHVMVLVLALVLVTGCAVPPFEFNSETPNLNIDLSQKRPLNIAIVVQDPMDYTLFYKGQGGYSRDGTAESRSRGFPIERDLSKISEETFSQIFTQVVVLRDLPQPGQYDAVVNLSIGQILMKERVIVTGETCDVTADWYMSVLDNQNREIFSKKVTSPAHNFKWSAMSPSRDMTIGLNATLSVILSELAREWGNILYAMKIPAT
jgi:hypothetical protein